jgi:hypothetical protein
MLVGGLHLAKDAKEMGTMLLMALKGLSERCLPQLENVPVPADFSDVTLYRVVGTSEQYSMVLRYGEDKYVADIYPNGTFHLMEPHGAPVPHNHPAAGRVWSVMEALLPHLYYIQNELRCAKS